ncbi:MAG: hypothetical protein MUC86_16760, partial [Burkholderiaceae bacterium]|nr:hypothetical protein [Burkholderiaceae bacterium]
VAAGQRRGSIGGQPAPITGLSWYCDDTGTRCYYTGSLNAFHAFVYWDRARNASAVFVSNSTLPPWQAISLQRALVAALAGEVVAAAPTESFERFDRSTRAAVAGLYRAPGLGAVELIRTESRLQLRVDGGLAFDVFQVSREVFYAPGPDYWLAFSGPRERPTALHLRGMFVDAAAPRMP